MSIAGHYGYPSSFMSTISYMHVLKFALRAFLPASFKIAFSAADKLQQPLYTYQHWLYSAVDNASFASLPIAKAF